MNHLVFPLVSYFFLAVANTFDKFLVSQRIEQPLVYAFFISLQNVFVFVLIPFGLQIPTFSQLLVSFGAGAFFVFALAFLFRALQSNEATRVLTVNGGLQPIFIFLLAYFLVGERLSQFQLLAVLFLISGTILMATGLSTHQYIRKGFFWVLGSSVSFSVSFTLTKAVFLEMDFISGLFWSRLGGLLAGLILLLFIHNRKKIFSVLFQPKGAHSTFTLLILGQLTGVIGFFLQQYSIFLLSVSLVAALQGVQFVFIFLIALVLSHKFPKIIAENINKKVLTIKSIAIACIGLGVFLLFQ